VGHCSPTIGIMPPIPVRGCGSPSPGRGKIVYSVPPKSIDDVRQPKTSP